MQSTAGTGGGADAPSGPGTDVVMPQMGESIFEGTITKWLKKVGDKVQRDEPLFEISTDKVDAEIPAPTSGVLSEIKIKEGTTVQVNTVVAVIGGAAAARPSAPAQPATTPAPAPARAPQAVAAPAATARPAVPQSMAPPSGERLRSSPLVRRIARESNVSLETGPGTGIGGRITKNDVLSFIQQPGPSAGTAPPQARPTTQPAAPAFRPIAPAPAPPAAPTPQDVSRQLAPITPMRQNIGQPLVAVR